jgi:hypothetical protein
MKNKQIQKNNVFRNLKNKKADVPVTVLVLGVFAVCTLAMLSFINSDRNLEKSFIGVEIIEKVNIDIERNNLDHHYIEETERKIVPKLIGKWIEEKIIFSVEYNP